MRGFVRLRPEPKLAHDNEHYVCVCVNAFAGGFSANGIHLPEKKIAIE